MYGKDETSEKEDASGIEEGEWEEDGFQKEEGLLEDVCDENDDEYDDEDLF